MASMVEHVVVGCAMSFATTLVHASAMLFAVRVLRASRLDPHAVTGGFGRAALIAGLVIIMFAAALIESTIWAVLYLRLGAFATFEPGLYFSMVTFTTLGYGDIVLGEDFRLIASFQAANGTMMFGWTAALIVAFVQRVYFAGAWGGGGGVASGSVEGSTRRGAGRPESANHAGEVQ